MLKWKHLLRHSNFYICICKRLLHNWSLVFSMYGRPLVSIWGWFLQSWKWWGLNGLGIWQGELLSEPGSCYGQQDIQPEVWGGHLCTCLAGSIWQIWIYRFLNNYLNFFYMCYFDTLTNYFVKKIRFLWQNWFTVFI